MHTANATPVYKGDTMNIMTPHPAMPSSLLFVVEMQEYDELTRNDASELVPIFFFQFLSPIVT